MCCGCTESRCFLKCFSVFPPLEILLRKQNMLPGKQNNVYQRIHKNLLLFGFDFCLRNIVSSCSHPRSNVTKAALFTLLCILKFTTHVSHFHIMFPISEKQLCSNLPRKNKFAFFNRRTYNLPFFRKLI